MREHSFTGNPLSQASVSAVAPLQRIFDPSPDQVIISGKLNGIYSMRNSQSQGSQNKSNLFFITPITSTVHQNSLDGNPLCGACADTKFAPEIFAND